MSSRFLLLLVILTLNTLAAIAYTIFALMACEKYNRIKCIMQGIMILLCPIIGGGYLLLSWLVLKVFFNKPLDYDDLSFSDERVKTMLAPDYIREINMVPLEDALAVSDKYSLRRLLLDVLKDDRENSLPAIVLSLSSDDSETSHYAASVLMDVISEFSKSIGTLNAKFEADPAENVNDGIEMVLLILYYLEQNLFSAVQAGTYLSMADVCADKIYSSDPLTINETIMLSLTEAFLNMNDTNNASKWADRLGRHYPRTLQRYTANLKVYYATGQRNNFFALLEDLKKTNIEINYEILMMIRLFDSGTARRTDIQK